MAKVGIGKAINAGLRRAMERDPKVVIMGEDIGKLGGVFRVTENLQKDFGAVEHHSESNEAYFAHTAGLRVVACSNPEDAYWMIQQAIESDDPIVFYEPKRRYHEKGEVDLTATEAPRPLFQATIARAGEHATLAAYGPMVKVCLDAATVAAEEGRSIEVVDLRSLSPLDLDVLATSVEKTGRLVVAHEAPTFMGMGAEIAAAISQRCFYHLESPVIRVGGYNLPYPPSRLEEDFLPDLDRVLDGVDRALAY